MSPERPLTQKVDPSTMVTGAPDRTAGSSLLTDSRTTGSLLTAYTGPSDAAGRPDASRPIQKAWRPARPWAGDPDRLRPDRCPAEPCLLYTGISTHAGGNRPDRRGAGTRRSDHGDHRESNGQGVRPAR